MKMMCQIDKKSMTTITIGLLGLALFYCATNGGDRKVLTQVKSGDKYLVCNFKDGEHLVNPEIIVDFNDGTWFFENGYANNCIVGCLSFSQ